MAAAARRPEAVGAPVPAHRARWIVGITVFSAVAYAGFVALGDARAFTEQVRAFDLRILPLVLTCVLWGYALRVYRWHYYLQLEGARVSWPVAGLTFMSGFALSLTPGKVGELVKTYYVWERSRVPFATSFAASVAERVGDVVAVTGLMVIGLAALPIVGVWGTTGLLVLLAMGVAALRAERFVPWILTGFEGVPRLRPLTARLRRIHDVIRRLLAPGPLVVSLVLAMASWAIEVHAMWLLSRGFGLEVPWLVCSLVFTASSLAGVLTFIPGGIGATEGGMVALLALGGVGLSAATALTVATRLCTLWFSVFLGALAILALKGPRPPATSGTASR